jgi:hypothetical protein
MRRCSPHYRRHALCSPCGVATTTRSGHTRRCAVRHQPRSGCHRARLTQARCAPAALTKLAGTEKQRSTEQSYTVTIGVTATQDSIFDRRGKRARVRSGDRYRWERCLLEDAVPVSKRPSGPERLKLNARHSWSFRSYARHCRVKGPHLPSRTGIEIAFAETAGGGGHTYAATLRDAPIWRHRAGRASGAVFQPTRSCDPSVCEALARVLARARVVPPRPANTLPCVCPVA